MMRSCEKCGENLWNFNKVDCLIYANCRNCGYEVSFETKKKEKMKNGSLCKKCKKGIIITKEVKNKRIYVAYYYCPNCKEMYMSEDFKIKTLTREEYLNKSKNGGLLGDIF